MLSGAKVVKSWQNAKQTSNYLWLTVENTCIRKGYLREADYPFSAKDPDKITIPVGGSRKTAVLSIPEMTRLYEFFLDGELPSGFRNKEVKNRTLGMFLCQYLCNGCNLYDLALLRYDDYYEISERKAFRFFRHKTAEHSEAGSEVIVPIIPPLKIILDKIAAPVAFGQLVFPFILGEEMDPDSKEAVNKIHKEKQSLAFFIGVMNNYTRKSRGKSLSWPEASKLFKYKGNNISIGSTQFNQARKTEKFEKFEDQINNILELKKLN